LIIALENAVIPPAIGVKNDNPKIKTDEWGIKIAIQPTEWPSRVVSLGKPTARAGINSFGYGGANGHVILEAVDGPALCPARRVPHPRSCPR
jgi:acyl transferase domain-containing protein